MPAVLITNVPLHAALIEALSEQAGRRITAVHQPREHRRSWLQMAEHNASLQLARLLAEEGSQKARTRALAEVLEIDAEDLAALHVECFDISHTAGEATQASCVVFQNHAMQPDGIHNGSFDSLLMDTTNIEMDSIKRIKRITSYKS